MSIPAVEPVYFRHAARHIQHAVENRVEKVLRQEGWLDAATVPFGAKPVEVVRRRIEDSEVRRVTGNMVAISFGDEDDDDETELGGGMLQTKMTTWVDVLAESEAIGLAIASDIKDSFTGRMPGWSRFPEILDFSASEQGTVVPGWRGEFVDVVRRRPEVADWRRFWQVVNATLVIDFPDTQGAP